MDEPLKFQVKTECGDVTVEFDDEGLADVQGPADALVVLDDALQDVTGPHGIALSLTYLDPWSLRHFKPTRGQAIEVVPPDGFDEWAAEVRLLDTPDD